MSRFSTREKSCCFVEADSQVISKAVPHLLKQVFEQAWLRVESLKDRRLRVGVLDSGKAAINSQMPPQEAIISPLRNRAG